MKTNRFPQSFSICGTTDIGMFTPVTILEHVPGDTFNIKVKPHSRILFPLTPTFGKIKQYTYIIEIPDLALSPLTREFWGTNNQSELGRKGKEDRPVLLHAQTKIPASGPVEHEKSVRGYLGYGVLNNAGVIEPPEDRYIQSQAVINVARYCNAWNYLCRMPMVQNAIPSFRQIVKSKYGIDLEDDIYIYKKDLAKEDKIEFVPADYSNALNYKKETNSTALGGNVAPVRKELDYFQKASLYKQYGEEEILEAIVDGGKIHSVNLENQGTHIKTKNEQDIKGKFLRTDLSGTGWITLDNTQMQTSTGVETYIDNLWSYISMTDLQDTWAMYQLKKDYQEGGTLYNQIINELYDIKTTFKDLNQPKILGYGVTELEMQQVIQQSQGSNTSPLGAVAGFSNTHNKGYATCLQSFDIHGAILIATCYKVVPVYARTTERYLLDREYTDKIIPDLTNMSDQEQYYEEMYPITRIPTADKNNYTTRGYMPKDEYARTRINKVVGGMIPGTNIDGSARLGNAWTYARIEPNNQNEGSWLAITEQNRVETQNILNLGRTLANTTANMEQILYNMEIEFVADRPIPLRPEPNLQNYGG